MMPSRRVQGLGFGLSGFCLDVNLVWLCLATATAVCRQSAEAHRVLAVKSV